MIPDSRVQSAVSCRLDDPELSSGARGRTSASGSKAQRPAIRPPRSGTNVARNFAVDLGSKALDPQRESRAS